ncbi:MAG: COQ9 family protein [Aestuariivita sp.]|nr:COQ9 family protein [Aestuariivita sp.]
METQLDIKNQILDAALPRVPFKGWSDAVFNRAVTDVGVDMVTVQSFYPKGALGLAVEYHRRGDKLMLDRLEEPDLSNWRFRDCVSIAVKFRLEAIDKKEIARRSITLFSLPQNSLEGVRLVWETCDKILRTLGDTSNDTSWHTKRLILSSVYLTTLLYWIGDKSSDNMATWDFLDRRIDNVMKIKKMKAKLRHSAISSRLMDAPNWMMSRLKAPRGFKNLN